MPHSEWIDDPTITNYERLWRRIHFSQIKYDPTGKPIPSSAAFKSRGNQLSIDLASLTSIDSALAAYPHYSLAEFTAGQARSVECIVKKDALPTNPAHALLIGKKRPDGSLTGSQASNISEHAQIIEFRKPSE